MLNADNCLLVVMLVQIFMRRRSTFFYAPPTHFQKCIKHTGFSVWRCIKHTGFSVWRCIKTKKSLAIFAKNTRKTHICHICVKTHGIFGRRCIKHTEVTVRGCIKHTTITHPRGIKHTGLKKKVWGVHKKSGPPPWCKKGKLRPLKKCKK